MHEIIRRRVEKLQHEIEITTLLNADVELVSKILPNASVWVDNEVNVLFNVSSMDELKQTLKIFAEEGHMLDEFIPSETSPIWYLRGINGRIRLQPIWDGREDASCKLIEVGKETFTRSIYKLQCNGKEVTYESEEVNQADN